jgi:hypothetical protein
MLIKNIPNPLNTHFNACLREFFFAIVDNIQHRMYFVLYNYYSLLVEMKIAKMFIKIPPFPTSD